MLVSEGLAFALDLFGNNGEIMVNGVQFDALAEEGVAHAEENDIHGKDSKDCARKQESLKPVY